MTLPLIPTAAHHSSLSIPSPRCCQRSFPSRALHYEDITAPKLPRLPLTARSSTWYRMLAGEEAQPSQDLRNQGGQDDVRGADQVANGTGSPVSLSLPCSLKNISNRTRSLHSRHKGLRLVVVESLGVSPSKRDIGETAEYMIHMQQQYIISSPPCRAVAANK